MAKTLAEDYSSQWKELSQNHLYFSKTEDESLNSGLDKCRRVLSRIRKSLYEYPNVIGSGVSLKFKRGQLLQQPCIIVRVSKKIPNLEDGALPSQIDGCPVDVIETGGIKPASAFVEPACRLRPGNTIGIQAKGYGTIGCLVRERLSTYRWKILYQTIPQSDFLILSCNHVIADFNRAKKGDTLIHPAVGGPGLPCAKLVRHEPLLVHPFVNTVDAAVAKPIVPVSPNRQGNGVPEKLGRPQVLDPVFSTGATSGHTQGTVLDIDADVFGTNFGPLGNVEFVHSVATDQMAIAGDSGSVLVKKDPNIGGSQLVALAMFYAFDDFTQIPPPELPQSYFCDLTMVLDTLKVDLIVNTQHPYIIWD
jgi:hypothetical protein